MFRLERDTRNHTVLIDDSVVESVKRRPMGAGIWADLGVLVPGTSDTSDGAILAGRSEPNGSPILARIDFSDNELWRVQLPARAAGIALVELMDGSSATCLSTVDGVVYLFAECGSLLGTLELSESAIGGDGVRTPLSAGTSDPAQGWAVVRVRSGAEVISIDLSRVEEWKCRR